MNITNFLELLQSVKQANEGFSANCPACGDTKGHLSVSEGTDGRVLVKCFKGCDAKAIAAALGLELKDLFPPKEKPTGKWKDMKCYDYRDADGKLLYQVVRLMPKDFRVRRPDPDHHGKWIWNLKGVKIVPYRLPEVLKSKTSETIFVCEGEKDVDAMVKLGLQATCNSGGALKWTEKHSQALSGAKSVVVIADKDEPTSEFPEGKGQRHAHAVCSSIENVATSVKYLELPDRNGCKVKDAADWIAAGGTVEELDGLVSSTPFNNHKKSESKGMSANRLPTDGRIAETQTATMTTPVVPTAEPAVAQTVEPTVESQTQKPSEQFYYDAPRKEYLLRNSRGVWLHLTETQFRKELAARGHKTKPERSDNVSDLDRIIIGIRDKHDVAYAGSLAGYAAGFYEFGDHRILVTTSPRIIDPKQGDFKTLDRFLSGLLDENGLRQRDYLHGWIKVAYEALCEGTRRPGQALAIAGAHNCGKSLLQLLVTEILGGRYARPYQYMMGLTQFNSDLFEAEHLVMEDESSSTDIRARRNFGSQIKQVTVVEAQRCHPKNRPALSIKPFWRLTITLNDEAENLTVLPPLDDSLEDKLIIFRAHKSPLPMPTETTEQRQAFWSRLVSELPAFLHWLTTWEIPQDLKSERFGIAHFHHPAILSAVDALSPESRLLILIDYVIFSGRITQWEGTAIDLERELTANDSGVSYEARRLFAFSTACGVYLSRLARKYPARFHYVHAHANRRWTIKPPTTPLDPQPLQTTSDGATGFSQVLMNEGDDSCDRATGFFHVKEVGGVNNMDSTDRNLQPESQNCQIPRRPVARTASPDVTDQPTTASGTATACVQVVNGARACDSASAHTSSSGPATFSVNGTAETQVSTDLFDTQPQRNIDIEELMRQPMRHLSIIDTSGSEDTDCDTDSDTDGNP